MTKNPIINSLGATAYIFLVAAVMFFGQKFAPKQDTFLAPIAILSLFTLSAAVMAYVFGFEPLQLFLDGKRKQAVNLFLQTVICFAATTLVLLLVFFSGIIK